jgi:hypothetical protein
MPFVWVRWIQYISVTITRQQMFWWNCYSIFDVSFRRVCRGAETRTGLIAWVFGAIGG